MTKDEHLTSKAPSADDSMAGLPIDYARPVARPSFGLPKIFLIISGIVGGFGFIAAAWLVYDSLQDALHPRATVGYAPHAAPGDYAWLEMWTFAGHGVSSALLIAAAHVGARSPRNGRRLMLAYALLQCAVGAALAIVCMEQIYDSPAGMLFYIGAIPGLVLCVFPAIVLIVLFASGRPPSRRQRDYIRRYGWPDVPPR